MVDPGITDMMEGFETLGQFIHEIFNSPYALFFVVMAVITVLFAFIFKLLLSKIPMFEGTGDKKVNSFGNVISWCLSLLAVISIGWQTKEAGVEGLINAFGGPWGTFIVVALSILAGYATYKNLESASDKVRRWASGLVGGTVFFWMAGNIMGNTKFFWIFIVSILGGLLIGWLINMRR